MTYRRLSPVTILLFTITAIKNWLIPLALVFISQVLKKEGDWAYPLYIGAVFLAVVVPFATLKWLRYRYKIVDGQFTVEHGVLVRQKKSIAVQRIQTIDFTEELLHRLFGVVRVQIQTAGGQKPEVVLEAVSREEVNRLKTLLGSGSPIGETPDAGNPIPAGITSPAWKTEEPSYRLSTGRLLLTGLTTNGIGLGLALVTPIYSRLEDFLTAGQLEALFSRVSGAATLLLLMAGAMVTILILSTAMSVFRFAHFTVVRKEDYLIITRGLLERRQVTLPLQRIQSIRVTEELLWQPLGYASIHVNTVGYGHQSGETTLLFPLMHKKEIAAFLQNMAPHLAFDPFINMERLPKTALPGYLLPNAAAFALLSALAAYFTVWGWLGFILSGYSLMNGFWRHKDAGWRRQDSLLVLCYRHINRHRVLIPINRIQSYTLESTPLQRRKGLTLFEVVVASASGGTSYGIKGMPYPSAMALFQWLNQFYSTKSDKGILDNKG